MRKPLGLLVATLLVAMGLFGTAGSAFAQEEAGEDPNGAFIEITAYVCANAARATEVDFLVAAVSASDDGDCYLTYEGGHTFTVSNGADEVLDTASTTSSGLAAFEVDAPDTLYVTETNTITSTSSFTVAPGDYVSITFIEYTSGEAPAEPQGGDSQLWIEHKICEDADLAGTTVFFIGNSDVQQADESIDCEFGVGTEFTLTPVDVVDVDSVESAGAVGAITLTTDEGGLTGTETVAAGKYTVTEVGNGATSPEFGVVGLTQAIVTAVDYVEPAAEPVETASLTIHKSVCETGVGADIFESCHDDAVEDVTFWVNDAEWTTDEDGVATGDVEAGDVEIAEDEATFDDYLGGYVYCSEQGSGDVLIDTDTQDGVVAITVAAGDEVICDWYNIAAATVAPDDDDDKDDDKDDEEDVTQLPATGAGVTASDSTGTAFLLLGLMSVVAVAGLYSLRSERS